MATSGEKRTFTSTRNQAASETPAPASPDFSNPKYYVNRDLSWLEFNGRVLAMAEDQSMPLLERLRFLTICSSNLDEFFEVRVSSIREEMKYGVLENGPEGLSPQELLRRISVVAHQLVQRLYTTLQEGVLPALETEGIRVLKRGQWAENEAEWIRSYFEEEVLPLLTPIGLDPSHPFPQILNKSLNFAVALEGEDAFGRAGRTAVVQVPRSLPRLIKLPDEIGGPHPAFVMLSSVVHEFMDSLFPGMKLRGAYQFRVTRNSDLWVDEEAADNLRHAIEGELLHRGYNEPIRLEVPDNCPDGMAQFLLSQFGLGDDDLYRVSGPVNPHRLAPLYDLVQRPDLKFSRFVPGLPFEVGPDHDMFARIREGDVFLHHPYQSFAPVVELIRQAATDPDVVSIKLTLYRTDHHSPFEAALLKAAQSGKAVTAIIELRARFDEAANIGLANKLQEAGVNVAYGIVGYKAHAKMMLITRREDGKLRHYAHLGTGNYHTGTARAYTDISLLTCKKNVGSDVHRLFMQLTGIGKALPLASLIQSPFTIESTFIDLIRKEAEAARAGHPARIIAKMNALTEARMIRELYAASCAGVSIDLIVRGACCLVPGIAGVSENIRVRSIVGRFLEHSRVFHFEARGKGITYCASADWMSRNLYRRLEVGYPIAVAEHRERIVEETLGFALKDTTAWHLHADGSWAQEAVDAEQAFSVQRELLKRYATG